MRKSPERPIVRVHDVNRWIEAAQACGLDQTRALSLWRQLGGRVRTAEFIRYWQLEQERRQAWGGEAA